MNTRFREFMEAFLHLGENGSLFPKKCRACERVFESYAEYLRQTIPKRHVMEDCSDVMRKPYTMLYRHCLCGNTLVLSLTDESYPLLDEMWAALRAEAERTGKPLESVVSEFREACDRHVIRHSDEG
ncbi:MAG: hypothetical protein AB1473_08230 [Thermodesulfobacteriota bacterium]